MKPWEQGYWCQSFLWVQPHYVGMFNKALLHKHFPVVAYFSKLLTHFNTLVCIVAGIIIYLTWTTLSLWNVKMHLRTQLRSKVPPSFLLLVVVVNRATCSTLQVFYIVKSLSQWILLHVCMLSVLHSIVYQARPSLTFQKSEGERWSGLIDYTFYCVCVLAECANMPRICTAWVYKYMHT